MQTNIPPDAPLVRMISSNQSQEYFAVATAQGFEIIPNDSSSDKLKKKLQNLNESVEIIEMMYKTNFIVLVLSSARHKVVIWDDYERKNRTEITFNSVVKNVKLRKDMLVVILEQKTFIFSFLTLQLIEQIDTGFNPLGLCGVATAEKAISKIIALPNPSKGSIKVLNYGKCFLVSKPLFQSLKRASIVKYRLMSQNWEH